MRFVPYVDINNKIYSIIYISSFHSPPDFLLPSIIYPYYIRTRKGNYVENKKRKRCETCHRIMMFDNGAISYTHPFLIPLQKTP